MNRTRNRAAVKRRLLEIAAAALTDVDLGRGTESVTAAYTWDGSSADASTFWLGQAEGRNDSESIGNRPLAVDRFSISCQVALLGFTSGMEGERAAETALGLFEDLLRDSPHLVNADVEAVADPVPTPPAQPAWRVDSALIGDSTGPYHTFPDSVTGAVTAVVDFTIECATSLS